MNTVKKQQGFTIIEVVLVLAIAALIFLMIFIALPALQRGQRDTARKNDANAVASALNSYRSNNDGKMPDTTTFGTFKSQYLDGLSQYDVADVEPGTAPTTEDKMTVEFGKNCDGDSVGRAAAVRVKLESGSGQVVCTDA